MGNAIVERERELAAAARLLDRARAREGGALLLEGPAGIGKTAVLDQAARLATDFRVLRGAGGEIERELTFGLVRDLVEPLLRAAPTARRRRLLAGAAAPAEALLGQGLPGAVDEASIVYGLYWLLSGFAEERPVLLLADDLHWSDRPSLRFLVYLARRLPGLPVAVLAAARPPQLGHSGPLAELAASDGVEALALEPLSAEATATLVIERSPSAPDAAFTRACHAATGGNPLLLRELLETVREERVDPDAQGAARVEALAGPRLRRAVLGRLARLSPAADSLARAVAVMGDGCTLREAAALAGLAPDEAESAVAALVATGVFADRRRLMFEHRLLRSAVYLDRPAPVRAAEHARAASLLRAAGATPETVAGHLLAAGPGSAPWAASLLGTAAEAGLGRGSPESACVYLRQALEEAPEPTLRAELARALGNALVRLGDPGAVETLEEALVLTPDPATRHAIVDDSLDALVASGRASEARALILDVLSSGEPLEARTATRFAARLAVFRAVHGPAPGDESVEALRRRGGELDAAVPEERYAAGALAMLAALREGTAAEVRALAEIAVSDRFREADARAGRPQHHALVALGLAEETQPALHAVSQAIEIARARGSLMSLGIGLATRSLLQVLGGHVPDAETDARAALRVLTETRLREPRIGVTSSLVWALIERGEVAEAQDLLDDAPAAAGWNGAVLGCFRARLHLRRHNYAAALAELNVVETAAYAAGWRSAGPLPWRELAARARLATGDIAAARALAREELDEAEHFGAEQETGRALRLLAAVEGGRAEDPNLSEAITRLRAPGGLELARALIDQGAALRRAAERVRCREPLRESMEIAHQRGATALVEQARTELRAAGARPRSVVRSGVDALTPSEHRVATLAARGLTNAQIAQELFVTVRTVEMHLTATYRKLHLSARAELPGVLSTHS